MLRSQIGCGSRHNSCLPGSCNCVVEQVLEALPDLIYHKFYLWPNYTFCSGEEQKDFQDLLSWKSDDFCIVWVYEFDGDGTPKYWLEDQDYRFLTGLVN